MLYAAFYEATGMYNGCFNSLATWVTRGKYCHSEFVFKWTPDELREVGEKLTGFVHLRRPVDHVVYVSIYVLWGGMVDYRFLTEDAAQEFFRVPKRMLPIDVSFEQELQIARWLFTQYGCPYDKLGAMLCVIPWRKAQKQYTRYFCSQLMACALNNVDITHIHNPAGMSPNRLYRYLQALRDPGV